MTEERHELSTTRLIDAPRDAVWRGFAERLGDWWAPRPWRVEVVEQDLRAGGRFATTMHGPDGEVSPGEGVFLEVVPGERVVFTDAFGFEWVPQKPFMVGTLIFADEGTGTRYTGIARHWDAESAARHEAMGFHEGWGAVAAQLEEVAREIARGR